MRADWRGSRATQAAQGVIVNRSLNFTLPITGGSALTADQAASYIAEHDPVHADVLRLADAMGLIGSPA